MAIQKPPKNLAAYNKELRRIERFMRSAEKRGFTFLTAIPERKPKPTKRDVERLRRITPEKLYAKSYYTEEGQELPGSPYQRGGKWKEPAGGFLRYQGAQIEYRQALKQAKRRLKYAKLSDEEKAARKAAAKERRNARAIEKRAQQAIAGAENIVANLQQALEQFTPNFRWDDQARAASVQYHNFFSNVLKKLEGKIGTVELARRIQQNGAALSEIIDEMLYKYYHTVEEARFNLSKFVRILYGEPDETGAHAADFRPEDSQLERSVYRNEYYADTGYTHRGLEEGEALGPTQSETYSYDEFFTPDEESTLFQVFGGGGAIKVQGGIISLDELYRGL